MYFCTAFVAHSNKTYVTDKNITFQLRPIFTYKDVQLHILPLPPSTCSVPCPERLFMFGPLTFFLSHTAMLRPLLITVVIDNNLKIVNFTWQFVLKKLWSLGLLKFHILFILRGAHSSEIVSDLTMSNYWTSTCSAKDMSSHHCMCITRIFLNSDCLFYNRNMPSHRIQFD